MRQLAPDQYDRVRPLFARLRYNLVVDSVLDGHTPGWVYADDAAAPRTAWLWNRMDAMLVAGDEADADAAAALGTVIANRAVPDARSRHIPELSLFYDGPAWQAPARALVSSWQPELAWRRFYAFERTRVDWRARLAPGCEMVPIDEVLLGDEALDNVSHVQGWVRSFWPSYQAFVETGFGYALLVGKTVASWCLTVYAHADQRELGLATAPEYRQRGYATLVAAATVDHAAARGLGPHWHCWDDNAPSIKVAERVGFVAPVRYTVWRIGVENRQMGA
ncbi:MAG: GNAT family N-acetyltransferase [Anaerolineae bacterium]|jgi:RimJ/RimL family protein N-acetyltransferase